MCSCYICGSHRQSTPCRHKSSKILLPTHTWVSSDPSSQDYGKKYDDDNKYDDGKKYDEEVRGGGVAASQKHPKLLSVMITKH